MKDMKQFEPKDLITGNEYVVAYKNSYDWWVPCKVNVSKFYIVNLVRTKEERFSPLEFDIEYKVTNFWHEYRGYDLFGNKFIVLNVFDNIKECEEWCNILNK